MLQTLVIDYADGDTRFLHRGANAHLMAWMKRLADEVWGALMWCMESLETNIGAVVATMGCP